MNLSDYYLNPDFYLKLIEFPALYNVKTDELYCLDSKAFRFLKDFILKTHSRMPPGKTERVISKAQVKNEISNKQTLNDFADLIKFCLKEKILTEKPVKRSHPPIRQSPIPSLRYLELQITKRCNLRCRHCFTGECLNLDLSFEKISKVLREFEAIQGLRVLVTGGEPLLHPEFERINQMLPEFALRKILFTNGLNLTEEWLKKLNFHEIQISLDGMKTGHESLRGRGTFEKTLSSVKKALSHGFDVSIATVIHRKNLNEFEELKKLIDSLGVRDWTVDALTLTGNLVFNKDFWVEPEIAGKYMKKYGFSKEEHPRAEGYGCGAHLLAVLATGNAAFCSFFEQSPIGSIDEGLEILWKKKKHVLLKDLECSKKNCPFIYQCLGGCRYRAILTSGKEDSIDLFKCSQMSTY